MANILSVGPGQQFRTIAAAVAAAQSGDTINIQAGTYTNDFLGIYKSLTLQAVGGSVKMLATVSPPNRKAIIDEGGSGVSVTINGFEISGAVVPDGNGAAIRYEGGNLTLNNDYFHNNQDGLLANSDLAGSITINNSEFGYNGTGDGYTHNIYVNDIKNLTISNSYFHDASVGHEIKSRAESTTITGTRIFDNNSTASYSIDLPNGGNALIQNNVIQQGPNSENSAIIAYGEEGGLHAGTSVTIANNTIVNAKSSAVGVMNRAPYAVTLQGNSVYGLASGNLTSGPANVSGTTYLSSSPVLDTASHWNVTTPPPPPPTDMTLIGTAGNDTLTGGPGNDTLDGRAGADITSGGAGNDTYYVDNAGDVVNEATAQGSDTVYASVSYALTQGSEIEFLRGNAGATGLALTGNQFANTIVGGTGNDTLNGVVGADIMSGGAGNDIYYVDNAGDVVNEATAQGFDTIYASVSYALTPGSEIENLRGNAGATGLGLTGNEFANTIVGGVGNDILDGGAGNDTLNGVVGADLMRGGAGNDIYYVDNAGDVVNEATAQGSDTVYASANYILTQGSEIEFLQGRAGTTGLALTGNAFANTIVGGTGNDILDGGAANDTLTGGVGNDIFRFMAGFGQDIVTDLTSSPAGNQDLLDISALGITASNFAASVGIAAGSGGSTLITIGSNSIKLLNVAPTSIDMTDFRLA